MPKYWLTACFSQVIKHDVGKHKLDGTVRQKLGVENGKKWVFWHSKTGNTGKKVQCQAISIM